MRREDPLNKNFEHLRQGKGRPAETFLLEPGNVLIPESSLAVLTVIASSVVVTIFDVESKRGGLCHFIRPLPGDMQKSTPIFGLPAIAALVRGFVDMGACVKNLRAGIYGGAWPEWANAEQRKIARGNVEVCRDAISKKNILIQDEDVGGQRGRKVVYITGTDEVVIVKTDQIRQSDWFPPLPKEMLSND